MAETISLDTFMLLFASLGEKVPSFDMFSFLLITDRPSSTLEILRALVPTLALG